MTLCHFHFQSMWLYNKNVFIYHYNGLVAWCKIVCYSSWICLSVPIVITCSVVPQNPGIWNGSLVPRPHFSHPLEKWVWSTPFSFKCTRVLVHCFCYLMLDIMMIALHIACQWSASQMYIDRESSDHTTISCIINSEWSIIKSPFLSIIFWHNLRAPVPSNKFQLVKNSCPHSVHHSASLASQKWVWLARLPFSHAASTCQW